MENSRLIPHDRALRFIMGGNAHITIKNTKNGNYYSYTIYKSLQEHTVYSKGRLIGRVIDCSFIPVSTQVKGIPVITAFGYTYEMLLAGDTNPNLEIWHQGKCCICGRPLKDPESIERGVGPKCAEFF